MFLENAQIGVLNLTLVFVIFGYYTIWVIGLPFVDPQVRFFINGHPDPDWSDWLSWLDCERMADLLPYA